MQPEFREIVLSSTRYNTRQTASIPGWIGVEAYDWVEEYGWSPTMVRRPQTLKRLYTALCEAGNISPSQPLPD